MKKKEIFIIFVLVMFDQGIKFLMENLLLYGRIEIIPSFFSLTWVKNTGAAWSFFENQTFFLIVISFLCLIFLTVIKNTIKDGTLKFWAISLLYAGILGNLIDRIFFGYVKDYLSFTLFHYSFPVFNLADTFIVLGAFLFVITVLKEDSCHGKNFSIRRRKSTNR